MLELGNAGLKVMENSENCYSGKTESSLTPAGVNSEQSKTMNATDRTTASAANLSTPLVEEVTLGLPLADQVVLIVLYTITTTLSVVGNVLAIIVFTAGRRSRTDLRWFLINLAVADLVMAMFCMPFTFTMTMLGHWVFSAPMCPVVLFFWVAASISSVPRGTVSADGQRHGVGVYVGRCRH